jgi:hypothetical protein
MEGKQENVPIEPKLVPAAATAAAFESIFRFAFPV